MHLEHFRVSKIDSSHRDGIVQRLPRLRSVKFEESPRCGRETRPAGDDERYVARNLQANCQFSDGPWTRLAACARRQNALGKPPAACLPGARSTSRRCTRPENLIRVRTRQDLLHSRSTDKGLIGFLIFRNPSDNLGSTQSDEIELPLVASFTDYISRVINAVCLVLITTKELQYARSCANKYKIF